MKKHNSHVVVAAILCLAFLIPTVSACAVTADRTLSFTYAVGQEINEEIYRDYGGADGGLLGTGWGDENDGARPYGLEVHNSAIYDSPQSYAPDQRYAWIYGRVDVVGQWSFTVRVFSRDHENCAPPLANIRINLTITPANGGGVMNPNPVADHAQGTGYVLCDSLTLRTEPSATAASVGSLPNGYVFPILSRNNEWWLINSDFGTGWINSNYALENPTYYTSVNETAVYASASFKKRVGLLEPNRTLAIIEDAGSYYVVSFRGASGYIMK